MKWERLKRSRCPKCGAQLYKERNGLECRSIDRYYGIECRFFITDERYSQIVDTMTAR